MGRLEEKVVFITGAARGQGRSHAVRMAQEGASIIAVDVCQDVETVPFAGATTEDLQETVELVHAAGGRIVAREGDVRDQASLDAVVQEGYETFGRLDVICANAGIWSLGTTWEMSEDVWLQMIDVNLNGVWRTVKAALPSMLEANNGGSVILTSSMCGLAGFNGLPHYVAAKHGVVGLMKVLAQEVGPQSIRVNAVCPTNVSTPMFENDLVRQVFVPDAESPTREQVVEAARSIHALPVANVEPSDVTDAVVFLASDESRYITGVPLLIDAGCLVKPA